MLIFLGGENKNMAIIFLFDIEIVNLSTNVVHGIYICLKVPKWNGVRAFK
jgi:hypothetical protein